MSRWKDVCKLVALSTRLTNLKLQENLCKIRTKKMTECCQRKGPGDLFIYRHLLSVPF